MWKMRAGRGGKKARSGPARKEMEKLNSVPTIRKRMQELADPAIAEHSQRFFKTGPGQYGEGDQFLGIRVPVVRQVAKPARDLDQESVIKLLRSQWHEERLLALVILTLQFEKGPEARQRQIYELYLDNTEHINNWDLVDVSAHKIVGAWLVRRPRGVLKKLARSPSLWERRIAMMSTYAFIRQDDFADALHIAEMLLEDDHDLIHKVSGWMLREIGNRDRVVEEEFLQDHYRRMPRTMLRYAIEKFPEELRLRYLRGEV
jgi:3-methyladenine DNA glycosylase AlkD